MTNTEFKRTDEIAGVEKTIGGLFGNSRHVTQLNSDITKQAMACSENDSTAYRKMLEDPAFSFEEKCSIHEWLIDEREERARLNTEAQHGNRDTGVLLPILLCAAVGIGVATNPSASKLLLSNISRAYGAIKSTKMPAKLIRSATLLGSASANMLT